MADHVTILPRSDLPLSLFDPESPTPDTKRDVIIVACIMGGLAFVVITSSIAYCFTSIRDRRGRARTTARQSEILPVYGSAGAPPPTSEQRAAWGWSSRDLTDMWRNMGAMGPRVGGGALTGDGRRRRADQRAATRGQAVEMDRLERGRDWIGGYGSRQRGRLGGDSSNAGVIRQPLPVVMGFMRTGLGDREQIANRVNRIREQLGLRSTKSVDTLPLYTKEPLDRSWVMGRGEFEEVQLTGVGHSGDFPLTRGNRQDRDRLYAPARVDQIASNGTGRGQE